MNHALELAIDFPPCEGYRGAASTIADLQSYYRNGRAYPSKYRAVSCIMLSKQEVTVASGHGNRAARRIASAINGPIPYRLQEDYPLLQREDARRMVSADAEFEAREDALACAIVDDIDDIEFRGEARPHFSQITNPHE